MAHVTTAKLVEQYAYSENFLDFINELKQAFIKFLNINYIVFKIILAVPMLIIALTLGVLLWILTAFIFFYLTYLTHKQTKNVTISNHDDFVLYYNINEEIKKIKDKLNLVLKVNQQPHKFVLFPVKIFIRKVNVFQQEIDVQVKKYNESPVEIDYAVYVSATDLLQQRNSAYGNNYAI